MILTEDEIREEVSIKPSIKQKLTDGKKYPFVCNFLIYIFILVRCHKCRGFGHVCAQCPTRRSLVVPHHQQEKQPADQAKEVMVKNYHFHASLDNVRFH